VTVTLTPLQASLIQRLQIFYEDHERPPMLSELTPPLPTRGSLRHAFGTVEEAFREAGFTHRTRRPYRTWSRTALVEELLIALEELGREPRAMDFVPSHHRNRGNMAMMEWWRRRRRPHLKSFVDHFGSFNAAMREAGLPTQDRIGGSTYDRRVASRRAARMDESPTPSQPERPRPPAPRILTRRVGQRKP
jgi:hypothetical protein